MIKVIFELQDPVKKVCNYYMHKVSQRIHSNKDKIFIKEIWLKENRKEKYPGKSDTWVKDRKIINKQ